MCDLTILRSNLMNGKDVEITNEDLSKLKIFRGHKYHLVHDYQMTEKELTKPYKNKSTTVLEHGEFQNVCIANDVCNAGENNPRLWLRLTEACILL